MRVTKVFEVKVTYDDTEIEDESVSAEVFEDWLDVQRIRNQTFKVRYLSKVVHDAGA